MYMYCKVEILKQQWLLKLVYKETVEKHKLRVLCSSQKFLRLHLNGDIQDRNIKII